jgi:TRAP-type C4-dicarboxylate transport system permease small subunit
MEDTPNKAGVQTVRLAGLAKVITFLSKIANLISGTVGAAIASTMLTAMMFLTFFDVVGRYFFNKPIIGSLELIEYMMGLLVAFGLSYCAMAKGHIRVDIIMQYTSKKANQWFDLISFGVALIFFSIVTWQTWIYGLSMIDSKLTSSVLLIPVYPFIFCISIGAAFLSLVFLRDFLQSIKEVAN